MLTLLLNSCIQLQEIISSPQERKKIHIKKVKQEVQKLDSHDKRVIYRSIKQEIELERDRGDKAYKNGYLHDGINSYELVNFYEGYDAIPSQRISIMKKQAQKRAEIHYKNAISYISHGKKKKALMELNSVIINKPQYKETQKLYQQIKTQRDITIYLHKLENDLDSKILNSSQDYHSLQSIQKASRTLAKYDYKNRSVHNATMFLEKKRELLLNDAIDNYKKGSLSQAKKQFTKILALFEDDATAKKYIQKINFKQSKEQNLHLATQALLEHQYLDALKYANKVLQLERDNTKAKKIIQDATLKAKQAVKEYVNEGKKYYNNKNLDKAKECFEAALKIDKTNNTALIYHKKIQRQLQTIQSLQ